MSWFHFHHIKKLFDVGACFGKAQTHFIYVLISHTHTDTYTTKWKSVCELVFIQLKN